LNAALIVIVIVTLAIALIGLGWIGPMMADDLYDDWDD